MHIRCVFRVTGGIAVAEDTIEQDTPAPNKEPAKGIDSDDFREFILTRELSEVFLLLDNLAADSDTTISALAKLRPPEGLSNDWIERICQIKWPSAATTATQAEQAALVIKAKDYLNGLAKPASGSTIAFTLLFTQKLEPPKPAAAAQAPEGTDGPAAPAPPPPPPSKRASDNKSKTAHQVTGRRTMAEEAYPEYIPEALRFQRFRRNLSVWLCCILALTCIVSWWVAYGNAALTEYATLTAQFEKAQGRVDSDEIGHVAEPPAGETKPGASKVETAAVAAEPPPQHLQDAKAHGAAGIIPYCLRVSVDATRNPPARVWETAEQHQACTERHFARLKLIEGERRLYRWLYLWHGILGVTKNENDAAAIASRLTSVFGSAVLPILYGLLGAGAAVLRNISRKISLSTLSPRDRNLSILQLGLGAVTGACIGLFIVAPGKDAPLFGPVTLSGSAISFIAGFGVEAVFQALETLIGRVFNISGVAAQTRSEARKGV